MRKFSCFLRETLEQPPRNAVAEEIAETTRGTVRRERSIFGAFFLAKGDLMRKIVAETASTPPPLPGGAVPKPEAKYAISLAWNDRLEISLDITPMAHLLRSMTCVAGQFPLLAPKSCAVRGGAFVNFSASAQRL